MVFSYSRLKGLRRGINITKSVLLTTDHLAGLDAFSAEGANIYTLAANRDMVHEKAPVRKIQKRCLTEMFPGHLSLQTLQLHEKGLDVYYLPLGEHGSCTS